MPNIYVTKSGEINTYDTQKYNADYYQRHRKILSESSL